MEKVWKEKMNMTNRTWQKKNMTNKQTEYSILKMLNKTALKYERSNKENCPRVNDSFQFGSQVFSKQWWHFNIFAPLHTQSAEALGMNAAMQSRIELL